MISITLTTYDILIFLTFIVIAKFILKKKDDIMSHSKMPIGFSLKSKKNKTRTK